LHSPEQVPVPVCKRPPESTGDYLWTLRLGIRSAFP
jgi:hypothetical protein